MTIGPRAAGTLLGALLLAGAVSHAAAQTASPAATPATSPAATAAAPVADADRERFLSEAEIVDTRQAPGGITGSLRVTLRLGGVTHDGHIQAVDEKASIREMQGRSEIDFRDSFRNNVAAYRLDRLLGLGMVPVTVARAYHSRPASYTWWVDDVLMDEKKRQDLRQLSPDAAAWNRQMFVVRVFDQLIYNFDRNLSNLLIDTRWRIWMIDHTRAFKIFKQLQKESNLETTCSRQLLTALRGLDEATLVPLMEGFLAKDQIHGLLARRDVIVKHYDAKIASLGEDAVLYDLPPRSAGEPDAR